MSKICFIIAGPNGEGKTTFAQELLPNEGQCINFVNADLIADGLAPFNPRSAAVQAGKIMLKQIDKHVKKGESFAFETTLSGTTYIKRIKYWQSTGYKVVLYYFSLPDPQMAISRVKHRVSQGGHSIPEEDIVRRYYRS